MFWALRDRTSQQPAVVLEQLTSLPGDEGYPSFSGWDIGGVRLEWREARQP
jgi:hypothetical protein